MIDSVYHSLVEEIDEHFTDEGGSLSAFLENLKLKFGLDNIAYLGINLPVPHVKSKDDTIIITTYNDEWVSRYIEKSYVRIDPVIQFGILGILPVDWSDLPNRNNKKVIKLFGEASEFGIYGEGLSIPIHGVHGETAMFSVNSSLDRQSWVVHKKSLIRELQILAYHFHTRILEANGVKPPVAVVLSDRERECLKWAAAGKSAWETGEIIGVREGTVNFFLEQCRIKLAAANKVQAVAKAVRLSII